VEKARDLTDRGQIEALRVGTGRLLLGELAEKPGQHLGFETMQVVPCNRLRRCNRDGVTTTHFEQAFAKGDMMLGATIASSPLMR
jgi:hypothetical protein